MIDGSHGRQQRELDDADGHEASSEVKRDDLVGYVHAVAKRIKKGYAHVDNDERELDNNNKKGG